MKMLFRKQSLLIDEPLHMVCLTIKLVNELVDRVLTLAGYVELKSGPGAGY